MRYISIIRKRDGYIIAIVIMFCIIISVSIVTVTTSVHTSLISVKQTTDIIRARELAKSGMELIIGKIKNDNKKLINGNDFFMIGSDEVYITYRDESARIDINASPPELISGLFMKLGANEKSALGYANRIVDWRNAVSDQRSQEAKNEAYREKGLPLPRNGPFSSTLELFYVLDIPPELLRKSIPWLTTENGKDEINIMIADTIVLMAIPNLSDGTIREITDARKIKSNSIDNIIKSLGKSGSFLTKDKGRGLKIDINVKINKSIIKTYEAIVVINYDNEKQKNIYYIVTWYEK